MRAYVSVHVHKKQPPPQDPTVGLRLGPYGGPSGDLSGGRHLLHDLFLEELSVREEEQVVLHPSHPLRCDALTATIRRSWVRSGVKGVSFWRASSPFRGREEESSRTRSWKRGDLRGGGHLLHDLFLEELCVREEEDVVLPDRASTLCRARSGHSHPAVCPPQKHNTGTPSPYPGLYNRTMPPLGPYSRTMHPLGPYSRGGGYLLHDLFLEELRVSEEEHVVLPDRRLLPSHQGLI